MLVCMCILTLLNCLFTEYFAAIQFPLKIDASAVVLVRLDQSLVGSPWGASAADGVVDVAVFRRYF